MSNIIAISRHRMNTDGPGVRTLVGFYGCPMNCRYCINRSCHDESVVKADYSPYELVDTVSIDTPYFLMSHGGLTFGGGEPLIHAEYIHDVCSVADPRWTIAIQTSLNMNWENIEYLKDDIDFWYVDVKAVDADEYRSYTSLDNELVLQNLKRLVEEMGVERVYVRYPIIPEYTKEEDRQRGIEYLLREIHPELQIEKFEYIKY